MAEKYTEQQQWIAFDNDDETMWGILHLPKGQGPFPAVVIVHGYGGNKCGKHRMYVNEARQLTKAGIAAFRFDQRGAGDSDGDFETITLDMQVSDTIRAIELFAARPDIDDTRIGLLGRSLGGAVAVLAASQYQNIKSLALWAPVFGGQQWQQQWQQAQQKPSEMLLDEGLIDFGGQVTNVSFVQQFFAMRADQALATLENVPLIHFHGDQDTMVLPDHAADYQQARHGSSADSRFVRLPNSDHDFGNIPDQKNLLEETCLWFQQTLT